ncbi:MAG: UDP-N-acetylmuramate dehydrogenase [Candidatus Humimicrobiaceae bacterium]
MNKLKNYIWKNRNIKLNYHVSGLTSLGIGGKAHFYLQANSTDEVREAARICSLNKIKVFVIGSGTNVLFNEGFLDIFLVKLGKNFSLINILPDGSIKVGASYNLSKFVVYAAKSGIDFSFLAGIPGTVGGAVKGNSGRKNKSICNYVQEIECIMAGGKLEKIKIGSNMYGYRRLSVPGLVAITSVVLKGDAGSKKDILKNIKERIKQKKGTQPINTKNAGCFFKNPNGSSAGKLIEESRLKGFRYGGAVISEKHANFIINYDNASAEDIMVLSRIIKEIVWDKSGIHLNNEVVTVGF